LSAEVPSATQPRVVEPRLADARSNAWGLAYHRDFLQRRIVKRYAVRRQRFLDCLTTLADQVPACQRQLELSQYYLVLLGVGEQFDSHPVDPGNGPTDRLERSRLSEDSGSGDETVS
jgi:hypothetical protein